MNITPGQLQEFNFYLKISSLNFLNFQNILGDCF